MLLRARIPRFPEYLEFRANDTEIRIRLRPDPRARRYLLRVPPDFSGPVLTVPRGGNLKNAERFARQHIDWLLERLDTRPDFTALLPGNSVPLRGEDHLILATRRLRGLVTTGTDDNGRLTLQVPGEADHIPRKLTTWLKSQAREDLTRTAQGHADKIGKRISAISIRDTRSRWGSCTSKGRLSFSWRLILAPPEILDYVAAHEVAHLKEMNHSARFWAVCRELAPHTPGARQWLKEHGHTLHGYGEATG
jgi:predicted metal-dependent hydrolase